MMPLRFITENLGVTVDWVPEEKVITLRYSTDWRDRLSDYLTDSGNGYRTFDDQSLGRIYTYPQTWGDPIIPSSYSRQTQFQFDRITLKLSRELPVPGLSGVMTSDFPDLKNDAILGVSRVAQTTSLKTGVLFVYFKDKTLLVLSWTIDGFEELSPSEQAGLSDRLLLQIKHLLTTIS